jgi:hypothetical protein
MATNKFKREELYELVWAEPIKKLATRFEISDVGLAKACRRARSRVGSPDDDGRPWRFGR